MEDFKNKDSWKKHTTLEESVKNALKGVYHILTHHRNARLLFFAVIFFVGMGFVLGISKLEIFVLGVAIMIVFIAEVINTLIEDLSDLITQEFHPKIKLIKEVAAGAVLVAVFFSGLLGASVFLNRIFILLRK